MNITVKDYMKMQPNYPKVADSDKFYLQMAMRLDDAIEQANMQLLLFIRVLNDFHDISSAYWFGEAR